MSSTFYVPDYQIDIGKGERDVRINSFSGIWNRTTLLVLARIFGLELILFGAWAIKQLCYILKLMHICGERTSGRAAWVVLKLNPLSENEGIR